MEENYFRSLVEQELMMRSRYFLGSYYSSWSVAVWMVLYPIIPEAFLSPI